MHVLVTKSAPLSDDDVDGFQPGIAPRPRGFFGLSSIRRHKRILWLSCGLFVSAALIYASMRPVTFTAAVQLLVYDRQIATGPLAVVLPGSVDIPLLQNQVELLRSRAVLARAIDALNLTRDPEFASHGSGVLQSLKALIFSRPASLVDEQSLTFGVTLEALRRKLTVRQSGASHLVEVSFKASDPQKAVRIADQITRSYLEERTHVFDERPTLRELHQGLGPIAAVISRANPPIRPDGLPIGALLVGAALLGLGAGAIGAVLRDVLDNTIRTPEQLEYCVGLDCISVLPRLSSEKRVREPRQGPPPDRAAPIEEAATPADRDPAILARALRRVEAVIQDKRLQNLLERISQDKRLQDLLERISVLPRLSSEKRVREPRQGPPPNRAAPIEEASTPADRDPAILARALRRVAAVIQDKRLQNLQSLGVTSSVPLEGTSTVAFHLAKLASRAGRRVLLIDASCQQSDTEAGRTMPSVKSGSAGSNENQLLPESGAVTDGQASLRVVRLGADADGWSDWGRLKDVVREAKGSDELVIVDLPSLASGADVRAAADAIDGLLLIVKWGATDSDLVRQAVRCSGEARAKFVGAVLNMADEQTIGRYGDKPVPARTDQAAMVRADAPRPAEPGGYQRDAGKLGPKTGMGKVSAR
jgi:Mrp family chromosome partitioning ATPase